MINNMSDNQNPKSNNLNDIPITKVFCGLCGRQIQGHCADYSSCPNWLSLNFNK